MTLGFGSHHVPAPVTQTTSNALKDWKELQPAAHLLWWNWEETLSLFGEGALIMTINYGGDMEIFH